MEASFALDKVPVRHSVCADVGREYLTFDVPRGWNDVWTIKAKILVFEGREFMFSGWNSDRDECYFFRPLTGNVPSATIMP